MSLFQPSREHEGSKNSNNIRSLKVAVRYWRPPIKTIRGSALLTALFIMTLVAIVATAMSTKIQLDIYRTKLIVAHDKLYLASRAVTSWSLGELSNKKNQFTKANNQGMVSQYPANKEHIAPDVIVHGALYDLQARFNLNNLVNKKTTLGFAALEKAILLQKNETDRIKLALAINDWLSPYDLERGKDAYLSYYTSQKPPYYPSHQLMSSPSELRLVQGITASIYQALEPFITTLPQSTPINLNTASMPVLKSLSNIMKESSINKLIKARKGKGINMLKIAGLLKELNIAPDQITLESSYFLSIASVTSENNNLTVYTLLKKIPDKSGKIAVFVLRESFNVF